MQEDGKNYGDFLLDTVEAAKEQFTDKEYRRQRQMCIRDRNEDE